MKKTDLRQIYTHQFKQGETGESWVKGQGVEEGGRDRGRVRERWGAGRGWERGEER